MELTDRLSTLPHQSQLKVIERVFQKLSYAFGNQMVTKWQGLDIQEVHQDWADEMQDLSLAQINHGLSIAKDFEYPPSQGEFVSYCKQYRAPEVLKIGHKPSDEELEKNRRRIREMVEMLKQKQST